ncbi:MAG: hypothetical protein M3Z66_15560, partial [Chloroflexota bacterium]|nr:hypothetical protein [Chloroflexota bacterium]
MKLSIVSTTLAMVVIVGGGLVITARAQNSTQVVHLSEEKFSLHLGPPSASAHLTPAQALRAAETLLERWVFTQHRYTITYGSY